MTLVAVSLKGTKFVEDELPSMEDWNDFRIAMEVSAKLGEAAGEDTEMVPGIRRNSDLISEVVGKVKSCIAELEGRMKLEPQALWLNDSIGHLHDFVESFEGL